MRGISSRWRKLREKKYREEFVASQARRAIPFQIRALMRRRKISQQELADRSGLTQGVISRAANPAYGKLALNTIIRVAAGFDVAFIGVFVPFSKLVDFFDSLSEQRLGDVLSFVQEDERISALEPTQTAIEEHAVIIQQTQRAGALSTESDDSRMATMLAATAKAHQPKLPFPDYQIAAKRVEPIPIRFRTPNDSETWKKMMAEDGLAGVLTQHPAA
jgi:transcriptional regulator with XRE-family HTH domain